MARAEIIMAGDEYMAERAAQGHTAMAQVWQQAATVVQQISAGLAGWKGEAGDAARFKVDKLATLMTAHHDSLNRISTLQRSLLAEVQASRIDVNTTLSGRPTDISQPGTTATAQPLPVGAVAGAIPLQAVGTVALAWASFGLIVKANTAITEGLDEVLYTRANDCVGAMLEVLANGGAFLALNYVQGLFSALLFDAAAVGFANTISDDSFSWDGKRIALLATSFTIAETTGWAAAGLLNQYSMLMPDAVGIRAGALAGTVGGIAGPALITVALHATVDWKIWLESTAVGAASGVAVVLLNKLLTAVQVIAAVSARITALRGG